MESREFICPSCDNYITIKVLGSDLQGVFTLDCDQCRSRLTIDLSKSEPQLVEPPRPRGSTSPYNRLPPELVERERRMREAFEEAWGSPPPGAYLHDDIVPPPGGPREPHGPRKPSTEREDGIPGTGAGPKDGPGFTPQPGFPRRPGYPEGHKPSPFHRDDRPPIVAPGPRFPFQPDGKGPTGPPPTYLMVATGLLAAAAMMGFITIYSLSNYADLAAGEGEQALIIILENEMGNVIPLDDNNSQMDVIIIIDDEYYNLTPNQQGRYAIEGVPSGEAVITVKWPGYAGQKREVIITENEEMGYMSDRYIGNRFDFQLEKGTGIEDTEANPIMGLLTVCSVMILIFSLFALAGAYFTYTRRSYTMALMGGLGGVLAFGWFIGAFLALVALYFIHRSKVDFPSTAPPSQWGRLPPLSPRSDQPPPGMDQRGYRLTGYPRSGWSDHDLPRQPGQSRQPHQPPHPGHRWGPPLEDDDPDKVGSDEHERDEDDRGDEEGG